MSEPLSSHQNSQDKCLRENGKDPWSGQAPNNLAIYRNFLPNPSTRSWFMSWPTEIYIPVLFYFQFTSSLSGFVCLVFGFILLT